MLPPSGPGSTYRYVGANARRTPDGWESVGDMGRLDADGYLYLGDRRSDMILCGGRNIYPAEVEAALDEHPAVRSSCVIGLPDDDLGNRVHALVELSAEVGDAALRARVAERLVHYKVPASFERVSGPLRDDAGKVRRSAHRQAPAQAAEADHLLPPGSISCQQFAARITWEAPGNEGWYGLGERATSTTTPMTSRSTRSLSDVPTASRGSAAVLQREATILRAQPVRRCRARLRRPGDLHLGTGAVSS
jgi:bile acid-coenzyme A ligase